MEARQRSPSYPSTPLGEAIEITRKLYQVERTNPVDRAVAAKAMGYSGLTGRSATILSNLIQYGLLEKTGKNEVKVTRRSIDILFPDTESSSRAAMREAALEPELFQRIRERFADGIPSEASLEAFLVRQGFTPVAIPPATRAFRETFLYIEDMGVSDSYPQGRSGVLESQPNQEVERTFPMTVATQPTRRPDYAAVPAVSATIDGPDVRLWQKRIWLGGTIRDQAEADECIATIAALKAMLPVAQSSNPLIADD